MSLDPKRVQAVFLAVLEQTDAAARAVILDRECQSEPELRERVAALLRASDEPDSFLDRPASGIEPAAATEDSAANPRAEGVGMRIGPYRLLEAIGEGGMGVVFMAEQTSPVQRKVALKIIKAGMDTRQVIARFEAERQALAVMDHPNIAKVLDAGTTITGRPYFVMELVKGVPVTQYCDEHHLTPERRLKLFIDVCHAVQHAHQKGIIHRDLKPSNVLVAEYDETPVPKVIDFGVAKAVGQHLTDKTMFTAFGQVIGTVEYMSPEHARFNQLDIDTRSDVYSLGVILYELLTGQTPFDRKRLQSAAFDEMLRIIREEEPMCPSTQLSRSQTLPSIAANRHMEPAKLTRQVHGELDWIVMRCLEKDRNRRYETANGLLTDIRRYLHDEPVAACPPSARYRFRKFARRNKGPLVTAALLAVALFLGSVVSIWQALRARQAERLAQARLVTETEARQRAVTEAAKATAISALLQEALQSANPDHVKGADYTVRNLLDDLSQRLGSQLNDQPLAKAAIHATIGNAYRRLGQPQDAEPHLQKALELRRSLLGPEHLDVAQSLLDHSYNGFENRNFVAAEAEARQALAIFQSGNVKDERTLAAFSLLMLFVRQQGKAVEALAVANQALAFAKDAGYVEHRELAKILHNMVDLRLVAGDLAGGEQLGIKAVAMHRRVNGNNHPETGWALFQLGMAFERQGKLAEAEASLREALAIFRKYYQDSHRSIFFASESLQNVLTARGDNAALATLRADKAAQLSRALELETDNLRVRIQLGKLFQELGDNDKAIEEYSAILAKRPDMLDARRERGRCHLAKAEYTEAVADFSEVIRLSPEESWHVITERIMRGEAYRSLGRWAEAEADFSRALELRGDSDGWKRRGHLYLVMGQWDKAAADFTKSIDLGDHDPGLRLGRGKSYLALGQIEKAEADYSRAIELDPRNWGNWYVRARLYHQQHQSEKAQSDLANAVKLASNPGDQNSLAWDLATDPDPSWRNPKLAVELAETAIATQPGRGGIWNTLGAARYRNGQWKDAISALEKSMELRKGGSSEDFFFLAMAHWQLGNKDEARNWYDRAVAWMDKNRPKNVELLRFRAEAEELLNITDRKPATKPESK